KAELARRIGTSRQHLGRLESGERDLDRGWADKISKVLNCPPEQLLYPDIARIDTERFRNVFEVALSGESEPDSPSLSIGENILTKMLPRIRNHALRLLMVEQSLL